MTKQRSLLGLLTLVTVVASSAAAFSGALAPQRLRCEYLIDPHGIDTAETRLSWELREVDPEARGLRQSAYQVQVASSAELLAAGRPDLWDGGKVESDETIGIVYAGKKKWNFSRFQGKQYFLKLAGMEVLQGEKDLALDRPSQDPVALAIEVAKFIKV